MLSEMIDIAVPDGQAEAYVTRPDGGYRHGVLLHVDGIGLRARTKHMADRIASWGYIVMVPNIFYRDGAAAELAPTEDLRLPGARERYFEGAMKRVRSLTSERSNLDLDAYVEALLGLPGVTGPKIGFTGYCIGGRMAIRAAGLRPDVIAAAAAFHGGGLVTDAVDSPHRLVASASGEILAGHADNDASNPPESIAALDAAMVDAGITHTSSVYHGAPHGFTMADSSSYAPEAAERHFVELELLLGRTLPPETGSHG